MTADFQDEGYAIFPDFYDFELQIAPIQTGIRRIIELVAAKYGIDAPCSVPKQAMTDGIMAIAAANRAWAGEVYDAVKQIPAFMQLVCHQDNADLFKKLRPGSEPGVAAGGYGIRMDFPSEDKYRANWHQEFPAQLRSPDGLVYWTPLLPVTEDMGPVEICPGSQKEGIVPVAKDDGGVGKSGAYALRLHNEEERLAKYERIAPLSKPGDLIVMDFLTLHQSGANRAAHPRWSMQFRWFNFNNPVGTRIGWKGSFAAGIKFEDVFPELAV
ncbi:phytanoyl-CoA dioxygenase family protein [Roseovarius sp. SCSIO 43702]|uniref:phytanoyl-CoA dioxygenase family protein n=1 Tax=Roseovarius sp. SCSIO 43702 TaxID=2823043 RepID=UPI001C729FCE|nr:phytanoyl-CoA dioxygenase family protein [Roseovarius sp. SCSIO 43702]QYX55683.1 phytanoyl-CoA dioxygenase family protein [Roseovarius sp. SCSIO 43702]